ncbi:21581_t:CDS:2, partial [Gigaspora rosea]
TLFFEYTNFIAYVAKDLYKGVRCWITTRQEIEVGTALEDLINYSLIRLLLRTAKHPMDIDRTGVPKQIFVGSFFG